LSLRLKIPSLRSASGEACVRSHCGSEYALERWRVVWKPDWRNGLDARSGHFNDYSRSPNWHGCGCAIRHSEHRWRCSLGEPHTLMLCVHSDPHRSLRCLWTRYSLSSWAGEYVDTDSNRRPGLGPVELLDCRACVWRPHANVLPPIWARRQGAWNLTSRRRIQRRRWRLRWRENQFEKRSGSVLIFRWTTTLPCMSRIQTYFFLACRSTPQ